MVFVPSLLTMVALKLTASPSPITTETVALSGVSFADLQTSGDLLYFACRDPKNKGRASVKSIDTTGKQETTYTPLSSNVRSAVHEYGGGSFAVSGNDGRVIYTDFPSHVIYSTTGNNNDEPMVIYENKNHRFADFFVTDTSPPLLIAVMEDHTDPTPSQVVNSIVSISLDGKGTLTTLASGHDFYASPTLQGNALAYVAWDHPNMPWDNTMLFIQTLNNDLKPVGDATLVSGGDASVASPQWTLDDSLVFLSDCEGWYNLYEYKEKSTSIVALCPKQADFSSGGQGWVLGLSPFCVMPNGHVVSAYTDKTEGRSKLVIIERNGDSAPVIQEFGSDAIEPSSISSFCATRSNGLYFVGGSTKEPPAIYFWETPGKGTAQLILPSMDPSVNLKPLQYYMSEPRLVEFPSGNGHAYGYYYPPTNVSPDLGSDFQPPLLVKVHGGPTSQTSFVFRLEIQFWTSRGFAVLDVDYGGSTGHGKEFRQSLQGNWGITDINDVCNGALWCVEQGLANRDWLCIDGRSAGGYTTMAALTFKDVFSAGASLYGVSDLVTLAKDTHKFESRYLDGLVGPYPEYEKTYQERGPINYTEKLSCPMILLQGDEDKIVPPDQAETMFEVLKAKGLQTALVMYKGEQHGFRKGENIRHALNSEYDFFCQVFGFEPQAEEGMEQVKVGERVDV